MVERAFEFLSYVVRKSLCFQYNGLHLGTVQIILLCLCNLQDFYLALVCFS